MSIWDSVWMELASHPHPSIAKVARMAASSRDALFSLRSKAVLDFQIAAAESLVSIQYDTREPVRVWVGSERVAEHMATSYEAAHGGSLVGLSVVHPEGVFAPGILVRMGAEPVCDHITAQVSSEAMEEARSTSPVVRRLAELRVATAADVDFALSDDTGVPNADKLSEFNEAVGRAVGRIIAHQRKPFDVEFSDEATARAVVAGAHTGPVIAATGEVHTPFGTGWRALTQLIV